MGRITTRRAIAADAAPMAEIAAASYLAYVDRMGGQRPAPMDADYAESIARGLAWVAEAEGHQVGLLVLVERADHVLLENVAVHPNWQGHGIGRRLMTIAEDRARATGTHLVRLYTNAVMTENQRLYARLGYVEVDRRVDAGFARVFYEKRLTT